MAHENFYERQAHVRNLINNNTVFAPQLKKSLANKYGCSLSAIYADIVSINRDITDIVRTNGHCHWASVYASGKIRKEIYLRDGFICQYCEDDGATTYVIEHIIPAAFGGHAMPYNLVVACQRCNRKKGRKVWIPKNLKHITESENRWMEEIISLADVTSPFEYRNGSIIRVTAIELHNRVTLSDSDTYRKVAD
jgi:hypothetical protein